MQWPQLQLHAMLPMTIALMSAFSCIQMTPADLGARTLPTEKNKLKVLLQNLYIHNYAYLHIGIYGRYVWERCVYMEIALNAIPYVG